MRIFIIRAVLFIRVFFSSSALDNDLKKQVVLFSSYLTISCSTCRIWSDVLWWLLVKWFIFRVSENHDKSGHKNCLRCPHNSGKLQLNLNLRQLHGQCWVLGSQTSHERVPNSTKMYSTVTLVWHINKKDFSIKCEGHRKEGQRKASGKSCSFDISRH